MQYYFSFKNEKKKQLYISIFITSNSTFLINGISRLKQTNKHKTNREIATSNTTV